MLSIAFVLCAMQALALATPVRREQGGIPIALSKRQLNIFEPDSDVVNGDLIETLIDFVNRYEVPIWCVHLGTDVYAVNTARASTYTRETPEKPTHSILRRHSI